MQASRTGWAAQALVVPTGAERVEVDEVEVIEEEEVDWAAARVKPAARRKVVSCMVYGRESLSTGLQAVWNECIECEG